jgi:predicted histone-like DNA-binding protein
MAVKISFPCVAQQFNLTVGTTPGTRYKSRALRTQKITTDTLIEEIVEVEGLTRGDVLNVLSALTERLKWHIGSGHSVQLGDLGTFTPYIHSQAQTTLALAKANIPNNTMKITFTPSVAFKKFIKDNVSFVEADIQITGLQP